jgi:hypothetical protein
MYKVDCRYFRIRTNEKRRRKDPNIDGNEPLDRHRKGHAVRTLTNYVDEKEGSDSVKEVAQSKWYTVGRRGLRGRRVFRHAERGQRRRFLR